MNRAVDELPVLLNGSLPNHIGRPISRLTDKVVTSSTVSPEKAEKPPPLPPSSNCAGTTITNSDRQQSGSISSIPVLPAAADPVASSETLPPVLEKPNVDLFEWQRIYFSLAKEEKEEEFIHLKNSSNKLPPPCPKKKPKTNNHLQQPESITTNGNSNNNTPSSNTNNGSSKNHGICENSVGGGDILLQWGQNKRSRGSRSENGSTQARQVIKIQRRVATGTEKPPSCNNYPPASTAGYTRGVGLRPCTPLREVTTRSQVRLPERAYPASVSHCKSMMYRKPRSHIIQEFEDMWDEWVRHPPTNTLCFPCTVSMDRNLDELPTMLNGSASSNSGRPISRLTDKRATASPDKATKPPAACPPLPTPANNGHHQESSGPASADEPSNTATPPVKVNMDLFEWPKIYISLSRKEKEDDFMAIKGTKLPQRPKRRAKIVDRNLQYCFPGMWLSDLSRGRYEVREKKCVKKKRRGLKGLESMDSDSD